MSSPLYEVEVLDKAEKIISLQVSIIHPDERVFYQRKNFVLQLLWSVDSGFFEKKPAVFKDITMQIMNTPAWVLAHENDYIADFDIIGTKNYPREPGSKATPEAYYTINVVSPEVIQHLEVGKKWDSTAYNMEGYIE